MPKTGKVGERLYPLMQAGRGGETPRIGLVYVELIAVIVPDARPFEEPEQSPSFYGQAGPVPGAGNRLFAACLGANMGIE